MKQRILTFFMLLLGISATAELRFASVFTDRLVLQQQAKVNVWGYASPGSRLCLQPSWKKDAVYTVADEGGHWKAVLQTPSGSFTEYSLSLTDGQDTVVLRKVCMGEVWFCSGQSNMEMRMGNDIEWKLFVENADAEIAAADFPYIRFLTVERNESFVPLEEVMTAGWQECRPQTAAKLSAVAYYFARQLLPEVDMPVGLLVDAYGGSPIQSWLPQEVAVPDFYKDETVRLTAAREKGKEKPDYDMISALYNAMVYPLVDYSIRGWLWYQGESNVGDAGRYPRMMKELVSSWRKAWKGEYPFYFVQIAPFKYPGYQSGKWAELAAVQQKVQQEIPRSGMVVIADSGDPENIHPGKKKTVGERLARLVLADTYGKNYPAQSPYVDKLIWQKGMVKIRFRYAYQGMFLKDNRPEFELSADGHTYFPAEIRLDGRWGWLFTPQVEQPRYVRYGWRDDCVSDVYNSERLPLGPFEALVNETEE